MSIFVVGHQRIILTGVWTIVGKILITDVPLLTCGWGEDMGVYLKFKVWTYFPWATYFNSLAPGRSEYDPKNAIFNLVLLIGFFRSSNDNAPRWMPWDLTDDKSTLVQVMAWCRQATSHYLSQCWLSSMTPYGITRPQWVKCPNYLLWHRGGNDLPTTILIPVCTICVGGCLEH